MRRALGATEAAIKTTTAALASSDGSVSHDEVITKAQRYTPARHCESAGAEATVAVLVGGRGNGLDPQRHPAT
ncbi:hypothetical protein [Streptomyces sp. NPDC127112]|uniref:hypothetical protein n=1 Tax=Streptomyces sp. NPDC127112 TaxID=3345364 RepID=UPI0036267643